MGGAIREKAYSNKIHTLDLKRGVWYELEGTLPAGRCGRMNGILVRDKVYFWGGYHTPLCGQQRATICGRENGGDCVT